MHIQWKHTVLVCKLCNLRVSILSFVQYKQTVLVAGDLAHKHFPDLRDVIKDVRESGMFALEDLPWVSRCIGGRIRVTLEEKTHKTIMEKHNSNMERDCFFGQGEVKAHLFFQWVEMNDATGRMVGHYDLLSPKASAVSLLLPPDDSLLLISAFFLDMSFNELYCLYRYI